MVLDYNRDGKPDVLLLGAVAEAGRVRDLLLRNDGDAVFTDVTAEAGLGGARASLGWTPVHDFEALVVEMVEEDLAQLRGKELNAPAATP